MAGKAFVKIAKVTANKGDTVDCIPQIAAVEEDGTPHPYPTCISVPLMTLGGGGGQVKVSPQPGDIVLLIVTDESLDEWRASKSDTVPEAARHHAELTDAIAIPTAWGAASGASIELINGVTSLEVSSSGVTITGNLDVTGTVTGLSGTPAQVGLASHTHIGVTPGQGTSGPPSPGT